jgi:hypothetical protein
MFRYKYNNCRQNKKNRRQTKFSFKYSCSYEDTVDKLCTAFTVEVYLSLGYTTQQLFVTLTYVCSIHMHVYRTDSP